MHEGKKDCRQVASRGSAELLFMILCLLVMIRIFKRNYSVRGGQDLVPLSGVRFIKRWGTDYMKKLKE